jgi:hypothetical protein
VYKLLVVAVLVASVPETCCVSLAVALVLMVAAWRSVAVLEDLVALEATCPWLAVLAALQVVLCHWDLLILPGRVQFPLLLGKLLEVVASHC